MKRTGKFFLGMVGRRPLAFLSLAAAALMAAVAVWRPALGFEVEDGSRVTVQGRISRWEEREGGRTYYLEDVLLDTQEGWIPLEGRRTGTLRVDAGEPEGEEAPKAGWQVQAEGIFYALERASNPGQFDSLRYWASMGIGGSMWAERIEMRAETTKLAAELAARWRERLADTADRLFAGEEAGALKAMLLGTSGDMEEAVKSAYRRAGILHLISVSGLHVTAMGGGLYRVLKKLGLPMPLSAAAAGGFLLFYGKMLGDKPSSERAIGMFLVFLAGDVLGEAYDSATALALLAAILAAGRPDQVLQTGFQLSFLASGGAIYSSELARERRRRKKEAKEKEGKEPGMGQAGKPRQRASARIWGGKLLGMGKAGGRGRWESQAVRFAGGLWESVCATLRIQCAVLPVLMGSYGEVSVCGIAVNLLLIPTSAWILGMGALSLLAGSLWLEAGIFLGASVELLLRFYEAVSVWASSLPGAVWICGCPQAWQSAAFYAGLLLLELRLWAGMPQGRSRWERLAWAAVLAVIFLRLEPSFQAVFLDVGQGDAAVVKSRGGPAVLLDGGSTDVEDVGSYRVLPALKYLGIGHLDYVLISHGDADHFSAVEELISAGEIGIGHLVVPVRYLEHAGENGKGGSAQGGGSAQEGESAQGGEDTGLAGLISLAGERGIPVLGAAEGSSLKAGAMEIRCLFPPADWTGSTENNGSVVWKVSCQGLRLLFTGDMEEEEERALLQSYGGREEELEADILKAAHHGSRTSGGEDFLAAVRPRAAILSCGRDNPYGHPHQETLERLDGAGCRYFITAREGAVSVVQKGRRTEIRPYL